MRRDASTVALVQLGRAGDETARFRATVKVEDSFLYRDLSFPEGTTAADQAAAIAKAFMEMAQKAAAMAGK